MSFLKEYIVGFILLTVILVSTGAQAQLPPEAKAKLLDRQIVSAIKAEDLSKADNLISEYQTLGVTIPSTYLFIQAKIANSNNDYFKSKTALERYFNSAATSHPKYDEALTLYEIVELKVKLEQDRQAAIARDEQARRDAEAKRLADIEAGKQAVLDRGKRKFQDAFNKLDKLIDDSDFKYSGRHDGVKKDGYWIEGARGTHIEAYSMSQYLASEDVNSCDFEYNRNTSNTNANRRFPRDEEVTIKLLSSSGRHKFFEVYASSFRFGLGSDERKIPSFDVGEMTFYNRNDANNALKYLKEMQEGCDIVSGKLKQNNLVSRSTVNPTIRFVNPVTNKQPIMSSEVKYVTNKYSQYIPADAEISSAFTHAKFDYDQKNYEAAATLFRPLAEKGHLKAQILLASLYAQGKGVEKSSDQALSWYQKAAEINSVEAQWRLGKHYLNGDIIPQSYSEAFKWFSKAAENKVVFRHHSGKSSAMYELGSLYDKGNGVPQSYEKAAHWYQLAGRSAKFSYIHYRLGQMFENGEGVEISLSKALEFYEDSLSMGPTLGPEGQDSVFRVRAKISGEDPEKLKAATNTCQKNMDCLEFSPSFEGIKIKNICNKFIDVNVKTFPKQGNPKKLSGGVPEYFSINYDNDFGAAQLNKYSVEVRNYKPDHCTLEKNVFPR